MDNELQKKINSICDLFEHADLITGRHSREIGRACNEHNVTPGEFLYKSSAMPAELVRAGIFSILFIRDGLISADVAIKAIQTVAAGNTPFESALEQLGAHKSNFEHIKIANYLLVDTNIITSADRDMAVHFSYVQNESYLGVLIQRKIVDQDTANMVLQLESLIRMNVLAMDSAVNVLMTAVSQRVSLPEAFKRCDLPDIAQKVQVTLGALLLASGLITLDRLLAAVEESILLSTKLGDVLVTNEIVAPDYIETALGRQRRVHEGSITPEIAIDECEKEARLRSQYE